MPLLLVRPIAAAIDCRAVEDEQSNNFEEIFWSVPRFHVKDAEKRFDRYLQIVLRIHQRIQHDPLEYARFRALLEELKQREDETTPLA